MSDEPLRLDELAAVPERLKRIVAQREGWERVLRAMKNPRRTHYNAAAQQALHLLMRGGTLREDWEPDSGALAAQFALNAPVSPAEIAAFENANRVSLPADYRFFLLNVGNGGAGPNYGVNKLGYASLDEQWNSWLVGNLSTPFPHVAAWNPPAPRPGSEEFEPFMCDVYCVPTDGAIPMCDHGCNIRTWLVVAGPEYGHLWDENRTDLKGLFPVKQPRCCRVTFSMWYLAWLRELEDNLGILPAVAR